jgi:hypothetical protein
VYNATEFQQVICFSLGMEISSLKEIAHYVFVKSTEINRFILLLLLRLLLLASAASSIGRHYRRRHFLRSELRGDKWHYTTVNVLSSSGSNGLVTHILEYDCVMKSVPLVEGETPFFHLLMDTLPCSTQFSTEVFNC